MLIGVEDREHLGSSIAAVLAEQCSMARVHRHADGAEDIAASLRASAVDLGWLLLALPEKQGGLGLGADGLVLLIREMGRRLAPGPFIPTLCLVQILCEFGPTELVERLLPDLAAGRISAAVPARRARRDGEAALLLGEPETAGVLATYAQSHGGGLHLLHVHDDGQRGEPGAALWDRTRQLFRIPAAAEPVCELPGEAAERLDMLFNLSLAADSVGLAEGIFVQTVDYLNQREQFGRKIGSFQALKHRAADLLVAIEQAAHLLEQGLAAASGDPGEARLWAAMCKSSATDMAVRVTQDCLQLHGGIGFTWEYDCHLFLKRARLNQMLGQDNARLRADAFTSLTSQLQAGKAPMDIRS
ncbi:MAG TPA: acyl-CoA dehydrogenase [Sphingobium sp.]|nr:acyl-CoA dehydrogenase [Sphingobium sp.]